MFDPNAPVFCKIQPPDGYLQRKYSCEVGVSQKIDLEPEIDKNGFQCCSNFMECFKDEEIENEDMEGCRFFKVQLGAKVKNEGEKFCSNEMHVVEEWCFEKVVNSLAGETCFKAVSNQGSALELVPRNMKTPKVCFKAVLNDGSALAFVHKNMVTPEMCIEAVKKNKNTLLHVPEYFKNRFFPMCVCNKKVTFG